jgi:hypothetical protein
MKKRPTKRRRGLNGARVPTQLRPTASASATAAAAAAAVGSKRRRNGVKEMETVRTFVKDSPVQVEYSSLELAKRRVRMENRQAYCQTVACMREADMDVPDLISGEREDRDDEIALVQEMTLAQTNAINSDHVAQYSLRNMLQYEHVTKRYKAHPDVPFVTAAYHSKYLRQKRQGENDCVKGESCEGMYIGEASSAKGIILVEYFEPEEEKSVEEAKRLNVKRHMRQRCCLLCNREHTHERCAEADVKSPAFHYKYKDAAAAAADMTENTAMSSEKDALFYTVDGHPAVKNTHQVYFGVRGEYRTDCIIGTQDRGSECTVGLHGAALTYARTDYSFAKDEDGRTIVSQDALLF